MPGGRPKGAVSVTLHERTEICRNFAGLIENHVDINGEPPDCNSTSKGVTEYLAENAEALQVQDRPLRSGALLYKVIFDAVTDTQHEGAPQKWRSRAYDAFKAILPKLEAGYMVDDIPTTQPAAAAADVRTKRAAAAGVAAATAAVRASGEVGDGGDGSDDDDDADFVDGLEERRGSNAGRDPVSDDDSDEQDAEVVGSAASARLTPRISAASTRLPHSAAVAGKRPRVDRVPQLLRESSSNSRRGARDTAGNAIDTMRDVSLADLVRSTQSTAESRIVAAEARAAAAERTAADRIATVERSAAEYQSRHARIRVTVVDASAKAAAALFGNEATSGELRTALRAIFDALTQAANL